MITQIKTKKDSFEEDILLFKQVKLSKINILFGGNGVGKTTFLNGIINKTLDMKVNNPIEIISYVNSKDNFRHNNPNPYDAGINFANEAMQKLYSTELSEGQSIIFSFLDFIKKVEEKAESTDDSIVVIIDEIDSGLSAENINMIIHFITDLLNKYDNIQFFISSNAYHFVYVFKTVLNMYTGKFVSIDSYDEFYKLLADNMVELGKKRDLKFLRDSNFER